MDEILKQYGLRYEDLNIGEKETLNNWLDSANSAVITIDVIREYIYNMRESVLMEVSNYENGSKQDIMCKARIRNYTLLLAFLSTPDKARQALERALKNLK